MTPEPTTATTHGARDHVRAMAGTVVAAMPTIPSSAAVDLPPDVLPEDVLWDEVVAGGGYTSVLLPRGAHLRIEDLEGDACAGLLLHRSDRPTERLNVADTVKVQWQAYLGQGSLLLSDMGRVLAAIVEDTSGRHDALCGTAPKGRDHFAVALLKHGLHRRDVAPNLNLFKGARVQADGTLTFDGDPRPGAAVTLRAELAVLASIVAVAHPLDPRPVPVSGPLRVTVWRGRPAGPDDPARVASPEAERAYLNSEQAVLSA